MSSGAAEFRRELLDRVLRAPDEAGLHDVNAARALLAADRFVGQMDALTTAQGENADTIQAARGGILDLAPTPQET